MDQKRLLLAVAISAGILLLWSFIVPKTTKPVTQNQAAVSPTVGASPSAAVTTQPTSDMGQTAALSTNPRRTVTVSSQLYEVKFDSQGATPTSWIVKAKQNRSGSLKPLYAISPNKDDQQPLQLIPSQELLAQAKIRPLVLSTGDGGVDNVLANSSYGVTGDATPNEVAVNVDTDKQVEFTLRDEATKLDVVKTFTFRPNSYLVDVKVRALRDGQPLQNVKIAIGPSISDQSVVKHGFYALAPEITAVSGGKSHIHTGSEVSENNDHSNQKSVGDTIDWMGVGDTYFAMAAIPKQPRAGLDMQTVKYEHDVEGKKETRYLLTGNLPIAGEGADLDLFVGPKDHYILTDAGDEVSSLLQRPIDLEQLINYGRLSFISRPLARPIIWAIKQLNTLTGNYGVAIIIFTIIIYSLFFPLKWRSSVSMKKAQKHAPRMKEVQEQMKGLKSDDPRLRELQAEQFRLMKEGNPLGGCLPLFIQMPFLFALFCAITVSIDFRQAPFLWVHDLSAADPWRLLPILMAASMLVLQLVTPNPSTDPMQRKMMAFLMPVIMLYILWSSPAGLLLYWLVGNIVGYVQQLIINKLVKTDDNPPPTVTTTKTLRTARA